MCPQLLRYPTVLLRDPLPPARAPRGTGAGSAVAAPVRQDAVLALPAEEARVPGIRGFTAALATHWHLSDEERDCAVLIVAELAANAARHGRSEMTLRLTRHPDALHIEVADHGPASPGGPPCTDLDPDEHGRGIFIVEALAAWVEIRQQDTGRHVRVGLRLSAESALAVAVTPPRSARLPPTRG